jgi:hypothetical protein
MISVTPFSIVGFTRGIRKRKKYTELSAEMKYGKVRLVGRIIFI